MIAMKRLWKYYSISKKFTNFFFQTWFLNIFLNHRRHKLLLYSAIFIFLTISMIYSLFLPVSFLLGFYSGPLTFYFVASHIYMHFFPGFYTLQFTVACSAIFMRFQTLNEHLKSSIYIISSNNLAIQISKARATANLFHDYSYLISIINQTFTFNAILVSINSMVSSMFNANLIYFNFSFYNIRYH